MWSNILVRCNETSKSLQSESFSLDVALKLVEFLLAFVEEKRDMFETYEAAAKKIFPDFEYRNSGLRSCFLRFEELQDYCQTFNEFYTNDVDEKELLMECEHFKHYLMQKLLKSNNLAATFPNVEIALRIFLCLMITNASGERSFSKLELIKNELRNNMSQEKLKWLSLMSIENDVLRYSDFKDVIEEFAIRKAREKPV
ncbi:uncharacterized protein [Leptinotarsa decemlineata]|uniref:uncharacterized protein n=1 Tax=Leptinotarsa decemlineata TaxID=7539 RepID=UPI003D307051